MYVLFDRMVWMRNKDSNFDLMACDFKSVALDLPEKRCVN
jgi:hypothetical protein